MVPAPRIKPRPTLRTPRLALHVLPNRHLHPASPTQNHSLVPSLPPPNRNSMPRQFFMAILASPIDPATSHLDRHNIQFRPPMHTPRLRIHIDPTHLRPLFIENNLSPFLGWCCRGTAQPCPRRASPASLPFGRRPTDQTVIPSEAEGPAFCRCHPEPAAFWRCEGSASLFRGSDLSIHLSPSANPYPAPDNPASATSPPLAPYDETHA